MRLNVEVEDESPNTTLTIQISGNTLGTITTNSFGAAELELNTNDGQAVPKVLRGDLVEVFQGTELVLGGNFDGGVGDDDIGDNNQAPITPAQNPPMQAGNNSSGDTITTVITIPQDADELGATGAYSPNPASVTSGSTITWNNIDSTAHTATADDGSFDTGIINGGSSGSAVISVSTGTSTIPYHCNVHPEMRGILQVTSSLSTIPSGNSTLQDSVSGTVTNGTSTNATIQNLQQEIVALQQIVDSLQQALMGLQQSVPQDGNATISSDDNNNGTTAVTSSSIPEEPQLLQSSPLQQQPQSQQQEQGGPQQNQRVSIVLGASSLTNNAFQPNLIQVNVGDTVTWINNDSTQHTVTSGINGVPDNNFNSSPNFIPLMAPGTTFSHKFTEVGEYPYFCALHQNMAGTVSVES
jgi:plastocyanin